MIRRHEAEGIDVKSRKALQTIAMGLLLLAVPATRATADWITTHPIDGGGVSLTNSQANSVWVPLAVMLRYETPSDSVVAVERESQGATYLLGLVTVTNASTVVWIPETGYPFVLGDVLRVQSAATNGQMQIIRKGN